MFFSIGILIAIFYIHELFLSNSTRNSRVLTGAFISFCMIGTLILSSMFMNFIMHGVRPDRLIYGRYNEGVLAPVLLLGVMGINELRLRNEKVWKIWIFTYIAMLISTGLVLYLGCSDSKLSGVLNWLNILGIYPALHFAGKINVLLIFVLYGFIGALLIFLFYKNHRIANLVLVTILLGTTVYDSSNYFIAGSEARSNQQVISNSIELIANHFKAPPFCISYDQSINKKRWHFINDQFLFPQNYFSELQFS